MRHRTRCWQIACDVTLGLLGLACALAVAAGYLYAVWAG
jgi:hypothetical protein